MTFNRIAFVSIMVLLGLVIAGFIAGQIARARMAGAFPPSGRLIDSGGHRLHALCKGAGPVSVFIQAGLNDFSIHWRQVQEKLAAHARICTMDRNGLGWSDSVNNPATLENMVADMHNVIDAVAADGPLILLGHSYGGVIVRAYAQKYPARVRAMVLVDPANEYMAEHIDGYSEALAGFSEQMRTFGILSSTGIMALVPSFIPGGLLHGKDLAAYRAVLASRNFFRGAARETAAMVSNLRAMQRISRDEKIRYPVVIISRGQPAPIPDLAEASAKTLEQTWAGLQADLVKRLDAQQVIAKQSGHSVELSEPDLIVETVQPLVEIIRQKGEAGKI